MSFKKIMIAMALLALTSVASASTFNYVGTVTNATGAFEGLTPPGTAVGGPIEFDPIAVAGGVAGVDDFVGIGVNVGNFCFFFGTGACDGAQVGITSVDAANVTFDGSGNVLGGTFAVTAFSPSFMISIPILFDLDAGTFSADGGVLGMVSGTGGFAAVVPVPAAVWLLASGLLGLVGLRRKQ